MSLHVRRVRKNRKGATAIEYALIAAGVALMIVVTVNVLGGNLKATYDGIVAKFSALEMAAAVSIT